MHAMTQIMQHSRNVGRKSEKYRVKKLNNPLIIRLRGIFWHFEVHFD